jgi:hypothetical protein
MDPITQIGSINVYISLHVFVYSYILTDHRTMVRNSINVYLYPFLKTRAKARWTMQSLSYDSACMCHTSWFKIKFLIYFKTKQKDRRDTAHLV